MDFGAEVDGGGFAFGGGGGGEDDFVDLDVSAGEQLAIRSCSGPTPPMGESVPWRTW